MARVLKVVIIGRASPFVNGIERARLGMFAVMIARWRGARGGSG